MPASSRNDPSELTLSSPERKASGRMCSERAPRTNSRSPREPGEVRRITRHPWWFRLAVKDYLETRPRVPSTGQRLRPASAFVIEVSVLATDLWGMHWLQAKQERGAADRKAGLCALTGVSGNRCVIAMRDACELGIFVRERILRGGRWPMRPDPDGPAVRAEGPDAPFGGWIWHVHRGWARAISPQKYRVCFGEIGIQTDPHLGSPSLLTGSRSLRDRSEDPAPAPRAPRAAAPPDRAGVARATRNPESESAPPPAANVASETPGAATAAHASPERLARNGRDREQGRGGLDGSEPEPEPARVSAEQMRTDLARLFTPSRPVT